jgi:uncharacterized protein YabE (DUF348 family)
MKFKAVWDKSKQGRRLDIKRLKKLSKHPFAVPVITGICLILLTIAFVLFFGNAKQIQVTPDSKIVIITDAGVKQIVPSDDKTVGDLLSRLDIHLHTGDVVQPNLNTPIDQDDFRINIYRALPVEIVENNQEYYTFSAATTPRAIATQAGITVYPADDVTSVPSDNIIATGAVGEEIEIDPATPITLNLYGTSLSIRTHAQTVGQLVAQENIHLAPTDQVMPAENTPLSPNEQVFIVRQGIEIQTVTQTIPMPIQTVYVSDLAYGTSSVVQQGSPGQESITYQENTQNGVVVSSTAIQTVITTPSVTEIVDEGDSLSGIQGDMALAGISPSDYTYVDYIVSHESGWCPTKWQGDIGYCPATFSQQYSSDAYVGYGLCQSTPPDKMASFGSDWETNPITQLEWCNWYAETKYGSWYDAYIHWIDNGNW